MLRAALIFALLPACRRGEPADPPAREAREPVRLSLLAGGDRVAPGAEVELAARFEVADGWHIYWRNPGESGLPTKATFQGPAGFAVGDVAYPGPERVRSAGGVVSYGYTGETALFARARAPANADEGPLTFTVSASWLACREHCVRGKGTAQVTLPGGGAERAALDGQRARLPRPWKELGAEPSWAYDGGEMRMDLAVPGAARLDLFPLDGDVPLRGQAVERRDGQAVLRARFSADKPAGPVLRGVLRIERAGKVEYYELETPWPC